MSQARPEAEPSDCRRHEPPRGAAKPPRGCVPLRNSECRRHEPTRGAAKPHRGRVPPTSLRALQIYFAFVTPEEAFAGDILFPVHQGGNHWILVIVPYSLDAPHQVIYVLDPYQLQQRVTHMETVASWLRHARPADTRSIIPVYFVPDLPAQRTTDTFSCGVFVCFYAYHFISSGALPTKAAFNTASEKGPANFRKHIAQTLHLAAMDAINWPVSAFLCVYHSLEQGPGFSCYSSISPSAAQEQTAPLMPLPYLAPCTCSCPRHSGFIIPLTPTRRKARTAPRQRTPGQP